MMVQLLQLRQTLETQRHSLEELEGTLQRIMSRVDSLTEPVRLAVRDLREEIEIAQRVEKSIEDFEPLQEKEGLKLHLGCGSDIKPGFVNIDLYEPDIDLNAYADTMFIAFDLRLGLPLKAFSCDFIYSSHFFEHLAYEDGVRLMHECYRALRFGGIFRAALPNYRRDFDEYLRGDEAYDAYDPLDMHDPHLNSVVRSGTMTRVDWMNYGVYQSGEHKYIYDEEKATLLLQRCGFRPVTTTSYEEGVDTRHTNSSGLLFLHGGC
jgi:predicted SAM-dependent methyltransferase